MQFLVPMYIFYLQVVEHSCENCGFSLEKLVVFFLFLSCCIGCYETMDLITANATA
jgi:hypothetical protein